MIQNNESKNENQPLETNLDDSLEVQQASETSAQTQNGHYINFSNGLDPPKTEDNHKVRIVLFDSIFKLIFNVLNEYDT